MVDSDNNLFIENADGSESVQIPQHYGYYNHVGRVITARGAFTLQTHAKKSSAKLTIPFFEDGKAVTSIKVPSIDDNVATCGVGPFQLVSSEYWSAARGSTAGTKLYNSAYDGILDRLTYLQCIPVSFVLKGYDVLKKQAPALAVNFTYPAFHHMRGKFSTSGDSFKINTDKLNGAKDSMIISMILYISAVSTYYAMRGIDGAIALPAPGAFVKNLSHDSVKKVIHTILESMYAAFAQVRASDRVDTIGSIILIGSNSWGEKENKKIIDDIESISGAAVIVADADMQDMSAEFYRLSNGCAMAIPFMAHPIRKIGNGALSDYARSATEENLTRNVACQNMRYVTGTLLDGAFYRNEYDPQGRSSRKMGVDYHANQMPKFPNVVLTVDYDGKFVQDIGYDIHNSNPSYDELINISAPTLKLMKDQKDAMIKIMS